MKRMLTMLIAVGLLLCACARVDGPETTAAPSGSTAAPAPTTAPATVPPETLGADAPYPMEKPPAPTLPEVSSTTVTADDPLCAALSGADDSGHLFLLELFIDGESRGQYPLTEDAQKAGQMPSADSFAATSAEAVPAKTQVKITRESADWTLTVHIETGFAVLDSDGAQRVYVTTQVNDVRFCYDEAEYDALDGHYLDIRTIPDTGQTYLEAAQELADAIIGVRTRLSSGSRERCSFVRVDISEETEITDNERGQGLIDDETYALRLDIVLVPDNYWAYEMCRIPNGRPYTGDDPDIPENAIVTMQAAYISHTEDGWVFRMTGTNWGGKT